jgi:hypothetical protein
LLSLSRSAQRSSILLSIRSRAGGYPGALKLPDLAALLLNLSAHAFDLSSNDVDIRHAEAFPRSPAADKNKKRTERKPLNLGAGYWQSATPNATPTS